MSQNALMLLRLKSLASSEVHDDIIKVADAVANVLKHKQGSVILSGCGTSGRIAFFLARKFNQLLEELGLVPCFEYLIAGGDKALFTSQEAPEDDPASGTRVLQQALEGKKCSILFGITCSLSAAFIAGQLDYCLDKLDLVTPVLLGFNPVINIKNVEIENWDKTFLQVAEKLQKIQGTGNGFIINPILGPEAITGSSRMKGGSATKIVLELVFLTAIQKVLINTSACQPYIKCLHAMQTTVCKATYKVKGDIAAVVTMAGESLNAEGHVYYIGAGISGILGLIDASECPPTYSSEFDDIRGFLLGGYESFRNKEGNLSNKGEAYYISLDHFSCKIQPSLSVNDTVIFILHSDASTLKVFLAIYKKLKTMCKVSVICVDEPFQGTKYQDFVRQHFSSAVIVSLPWDQILPTFQNGNNTDQKEDKVLKAALYGGVELSVKLILNAISTGAHVLKGKVYKHFMVDMKLSNSKLLNRGIGIVEKLSQCSREVAEESVLKSIYEIDKLPADIRKAKVSQHIQRANAGTKLVPIALVLANKNCTVLEAKSALNSSKQIRTAINQTYNPLL
ncbi:glucokinase regulatory protein-like isoform X2 [Anneissia japonica]|uniref:glucokinase regulatory protein-like isoform X2 n=1 Tax=Anneissia japonica TaxID=1529436 RepID=UPI00142556FE|nr:glucokinase regulatory protein-like isoform X2 [Anneissia japonica]